jgi:uncharacterized phiE125 gp8 family phage protein
MICPTMTLSDTLISRIMDGSPAVSPLTLAYAKEHIRALGTVDDTLTAVRINAAASYFEEQTGRPCLTETRQAGLDAFPFVGATGGAARIELPHPPLQAVLDVQYIDSDGVLQSFEGGSLVAPLYRAVTYPGAYGRRGFVEPLYGQPWPIARAETDSVRITYTCGYGDTPAEVPELVRGILCYLVAHFDQFPVGAPMPESVQMMLAAFKYSAYPSQVLRQYGTWINPTAWWRR